MAIPLTQQFIDVFSSGSVEPILALEIEGLDCVFGSGVLKKIVRIGDPEFIIGDDVIIGGLVAIENQTDDPVISLEGSGKQIRQSITPDKGTSQTIATLKLRLIDKDGVVSEKLKPDDTVSPTYDVFGQKCKIWYGAENLAFKEQFIILHQGIIDEIVPGAGYVDLTISLPDQKRNAEVFTKVNAEVVGLSGSFAPGDVSTGSDTITDNGHGLSNGQPIEFSSTGSLPAGLDSGYVVSATTNTFKVSATVGGSALDITDQGSGTHSYQAGLSSTQTTITVDDTSDFKVVVAGPSGGVDDDLETIIRINDELIKYTGKTSTTFTGCTRGYLDTTATVQSNGDTIESSYRLIGNAIELALKLMFSGKAGPYVSRTATSVNYIDASTSVANSIFFDARNIALEDGVSVGDYITTTGSSEGSNNVTSKEITDVIYIQGQGSYIVVDGVSFTTEASPATPITVDIRSGWDVWPVGLKMDGDQVDVTEHTTIRDTYLSTADMDFLESEGVKGKEFIETQLFNPIGAYGLPRKSRSSVGMHTPPVPGTTIKTLDTSTVINPDDLVLRRTMAKNFYNTINTAYDKQRLEDRFLRLNSLVSGDSVDRIDVGIKPLNIRARGIRSDSSAINILTSVNNRRLTKYKFGAEFIPNCKTLVVTGIDIEVGDLFVVDMQDLQITDLKSGTRAGEPRLFQVDNKITGIDGEISFTLTDTAFDTDSRYGLISHYSTIKSGLDDTTFIIEQTGNHPSIGVNEFRKWLPIPNASIIVRSIDYSTVSNVVSLNNINGNQITVDGPLGFTPSAGQIIELSSYNNQPDEVKLRYGFMSDTAFSDGKPQYLQV